MNEKKDLIEFLQAASLDEPAAGAIEHLYEGGHLSAAEISLIERFTASADIDTRLEAMLALTHYGKRTDLEMEAVALLVSALIHDDWDAMFGAIGMLGTFAAAGNTRAAKLTEILRRDEKVREQLQMAPP